MNIAILYDTYNHEAILLQMGLGVVYNQYIEFTLTLSIVLTAAML